MDLLERVRGLLRSRAPSKEDSELAFWRERQAAGVDLEAGAPFYRWGFVEHFGLTDDFYAGKRLLDVGCGPRGSLEWATQAAERVGLDPLADEYRKLHSHEHAMTYVKGGAEAIPFGDGHFDVVSSFNSLDHVDDADRALEEIARVAKPGATLLLMVDVNHEPTPTEPQTLGWDLADRVERAWEIVDRRDYERPSDNLYDNLSEGRPYDHADARERAGVLSIRAVRR